MREVVITGIGLVSCAGEGIAPHLAALKGGAEPRLMEQNLRSWLPAFAGMAQRV